MKVDKSTTGQTEPDDCRGCNLSIKNPTTEQVAKAEAENIVPVILKYLAGSAPSFRQVPFDVWWAKKLHTEMFGRTCKKAGEYRLTGKNIGVDPNQIHQQLMNFLDDLKFWRENKTYDELEQAVRLHHRAVQIHPFRDGNGRWSRMLANIYLRATGQKWIKWPATIEKESPIRDEYIAALKAADNHDFTALIELHRRYQA